VIAIRRAARGENAIGFARWWPRGLILSAVLIVVSLLSLFTRGLNLGIDFEGGTSWEIPAPGVSVAEARDSLDQIGEGQAKIQIVGADILRVQSGTSDTNVQEQVRQTLAELAGVDAGEVSVSTVGPSWGDEITRSAERALVIFLVVMLIYLSIRLEWQMAVATVIAMVHDIIISVGVYSVFQLEVTPGTVIAFLTILGYSIYDTIVVFDKVKENEGRVGVTNRMTYTDMVSLSMNQVLMRSINTTVVALLPVVSILIVGALILGAVTLEEFGLALFVGMLAGAYSSIFVAAPIATRLREREARFRTIRERVEAGRTTGSTTVTHGPSGGGSEPEGDGPDGEATSARPSPAPVTVNAIPPRPRKKSKGKRR
jgi:preprotein translocase subunit SecF